MTQIIATRPPKKPLAPRFRTCGKCAEWTSITRHTDVIEHPAGKCAITGLIMKIEESCPAWRH